MKSVDFLMLISPQKPHLRPFDVFYPFTHQLNNKKSILPLQYGIMSILGNLRDDFDIGYYDLAHFKYLKRESLKSTVDAVLKKFNPKIVGLQSYTFNFNGLKETVKYIKEFNSDIITVAGGHHVTFLDKQSIEECSNNLDIIVRGEGEKTMFQLINNLIKNKPIYDIKGITTKDFKTPDAPQMTEDELNNLPLPAFELIPESEISGRYIYFPISVSRGCVYKCLFCVNHQFWKRHIRIMCANSSIDIIKYLFDTFNKNQIMLEFCDSILPVNINKFEELVKKYVEEINHPVLFALTRANLTDDVRLDLLSKLLQGLGVLSIGIENGNAEVLELMHKPTFQTSIRALIKIRSHNLKATPSWLIGHPGESLKTMNENLEKIQYLFDKNLIDTLIPFIWVPLPGTPPFENPDKYHLEIISYDWDRYDRAIFLPPYHLLNKNDHSRIALSNLQIWSYFLSVISLCNNNSKNFKFKSEKKQIPLSKFLKTVKNDYYYTLFSPGKDAALNYYKDLDPYQVSAT
ncbi:MAG: B12-binding domain-containing radical SAM protein [Candidatus Helarchaeota archaeon]